MVGELTGGRFCLCFYVLHRLSCDLISRFSPQSVQLQLRLLQSTGLYIFNILYILLSVPVTCYLGRTSYLPYTYILLSVPVTELSLTFFNTRKNPELALWISHALLDIYLLFLANIIICLPIVKINH